MILARDESVKQTTDFKTKMISLEWKEAKMTIPHKTGDMEVTKYYRLISPLSHLRIMFTLILQRQIEKILDDNQPEEQAGFRKIHSTFENLQTINQQKNVMNFNIPLCIG